MINNSKVFFSLSLMMISFFVFLRIMDHKENINYQFNGKIDSVFYDLKGSPTIMVNGKAYYLSDNDWLFNTRLEKGDLVFKKSKQMTIKLARHNTGEVIIIKESTPAF